MFTVGFDVGCGIDKGVGFDVKLTSGLVGIVVGRMGEGVVLGAKEDGALGGAVRD